MSQGGCVSATTGSRGWKMAEARCRVAPSPARNPGPAPASLCPLDCGPGRRGGAKRSRRSRRRAPPPLLGDAGMFTALVAAGRGWAAGVAHGPARPLGACGAALRRPWGAELGGRAARGSAHFPVSHRGARSRGLGGPALAHKLPPSSPPASRTGQLEQAPAPSSAPLAKSARRPAPIGCRSCRSFRGAVQGRREAGEVGSPGERNSARRARSGCRLRGAAGTGAWALVRSGAGPALGRGAGAEAGPPQLPPPARPPEERGAEPGCAAAAGPDSSCLLLHVPSLLPFLALLSQTPVLLGVGLLALSCS